MNEADGAERRAALERYAAYALLRITLGVNLLMHGLVRLTKLGEFAQGLVRAFSETPLPSGLVYAFGLVLPCVEFGVGLFAILGLWARLALRVGAALMILLVFGTAMREQWDTAGTQMLYSLVYYVLLTHREHDGFSLDAFRTRPRDPGKLA